MRSNPGWSEQPGCSERKRGGGRLWARPPALGSENVSDTLLCRSLNQVVQDTSVPFYPSSLHIEVDRLWILIQLPSVLDQTLQLLRPASHFIECARTLMKHVVCPAFARLFAILTTCTSSCRISRIEKIRDFPFLHRNQPKVHRELRFQPRFSFFNREYSSFRSFKLRSDLSYPRNVPKFILSIGDSEA